jgi:uncharacterized membrane protein YwzB
MVIFCIPTLWRLKTININNVAKGSYVLILCVIVIILTAFLVLVELAGIKCRTL